MIGVIGGYGNIGKEIISLLMDRGHGNVTIGSRKQQLDHQAVSQLPWAYVDLSDRSSICDFMQKHTIIINAAGPSTVYSLIVAECAAETGAHLIDCGYHRDISTLSITHQSQCILYNIGAIPGLSELLPLIFRKDFKTIDNFVHLYSITGKFSKTAAVDFIEGLFSDKGSNHQMMPENTITLNDILSFYPKAERIIRYNNFDTDQVQQMMNCSEAEWYNIICGKNTNDFFRELPRKYFTNKERLVTELCLAAEQDSLAIPGNITFVVEIHGKDQNGLPMKNLYSLQAANQQTISATFSVAVCENLIDNGIDPGVGSIEKIKDPAAILARIKQYHTIDLQIMKDTTLADNEEGIL